MTLKKRLPGFYLWILSGGISILLLWFLTRSPKENFARTTDPTSLKIESQFMLQDNFTIRLLAKEPDVINPMTLCVDDHGAI